MMSSPSPSSVPRVLLLISTFLSSSTALLPLLPVSPRVCTSLSAGVGVIFGTSTGNTLEAAEEIAARFGTEPVDIDEIQGSLADTFRQYDALIVGTPTWNTGADTERSGTGWDEVYYSEMEDGLGLDGKKVAVFGLGDSVSYSENYADATGELHDVFQSKGCLMMGYVNVDDSYVHEASKAQRGDHFCGLLLDAVNQEDLTEGRIGKWVEQLKQEGFLGDAAAAAPAPAAAPVEEAAPPAVEAGKPAVAPAFQVDFLIARLEAENAELRRQLQLNKPMEPAFQPHYNTVTGKTMWTSQDGKQCFYTQTPPNATP